MISITRGVEILTDYLKQKELKLTEQRKIILDAFLNIEVHVTAEELYYLIKKDNPNIGITTVYRTLKLLCECGLANELNFSDGVARYEHLLNHEHHDHLICLQCGKYTEVCDPEIEALQQRLAQKNRFQIQRHRLDIYGICENCSKG